MSAARNSWELNRLERAWWHLRCRRIRLAWHVLVYREKKRPNDA